MSERNPISGKRFGMFTVLRPIGKGFYLCLCDCGKEFVCARSNITSGRQRSCGCWRKITSTVLHTKHGLSGSKLYGVWRTMHSRCENPKQRSFADYGGRGISVCDEWKDFNIFAAWAYNAGYREGLQIDRADNNKGYSSENCRWVTHSANVNNRSNTVFVLHNGERKPLTLVACECGISSKTLYSRLFQYGFTVEEATSLSAKYGNNHTLRRKE